MKPCKHAENLRVLSRSCGKDYSQGRLSLYAQFCDRDLWVPGTNEGHKASGGNGGRQASEDTADKPSLNSSSRVGKVSLTSVPIIPRNKALCICHTNLQLAVGAAGTEPMSF